MNRHKGNRFIFQQACRCLRQFLTLLDQRLDMAKETKQASCTAHFKGSDHVCEFADIGHALFAILKRTEHIFCVSHKEKFVEQVAQTAVRDHAAQLGELLHKCFAFMIIRQFWVFGISNQRFVEARCVLAIYADIC